MALSHRILGFMTALLWMTTLAQAGSLQLSSVNLDVTAPGAATALTLRNTGNEPVVAQLRLFKWTQHNGSEQLVPTDEVVASPPFATLEPKRDYTIRIVRVSKVPIQREETFRLLIDELPAAKGAAVPGIRFVLRYSLPVFFGPANRGKPNLAWSAETSKGTLWLTAKNNGARRVRLSALTITDPAGNSAYANEGLVGYVLGGSTMKWGFAIDKTKNLNGNALIRANSDNGPINANLIIARLP